MNCCGCSRLGAGKLFVLATEVLTLGSNRRSALAVIAWLQRADRAPVPAGIRLADTAGSQARVSVTN